ncbi:DUF4147 domain-containing protein [Candidatus Daviesbacteria bacterium]|nr:DUF4147 domain-containing protein [Candidatus Daviesbacteria bacterium]
MDNHTVKNFAKLATSEPRSAALKIAEAGLAAINTERIIKTSLKLDGNVLTIKDKKIDLKPFKKIYVFGFGKASCDGIIAINDLLSAHITSGIAIDIRTAHCENPNIKIYEGSHPKPTPANVIATQQIMDVAKGVTKDDLVICIVSGGGSSLLCSSETECAWDIAIYDVFLKTGGNINELNTLRKHTSTLKGGGLAKLLYPATVIGLVFSDIPGGDMENVASGPTFPDKSTLGDVQALIRKYNLNFPGINFSETPKEEKYFQKVTNILMVSNHEAVEAMAKKSTELGFSTEIVSESLMSPLSEIARRLNENLSQKQVRIAGGEPSLTAYKGRYGKGGRCQQLALESIPYISPNQVFIAFASDGVDNSDADGAVIDEKSIEKINEHFSYTDEKENLNSYPVFEKLGDLIITGPTGSNVSDLMLSLKL